MAHLDVGRIVEAVTAGVSAEERAHLRECPNCRGELEAWRRHLQGLRELEADDLDPTEIHLLRALFRELGPSPKRSSWIAQLVRRSEPALAEEAARGTFFTTFEEYRAGPWELVIQVKPLDAEQRYDVYGQLTGDEAQVSEGAGALLTSDSGFGELVRLDAFGEFKFHRVPMGTYNASWQLGEESIELGELHIGEVDDGSHR
jgi:hypothetical protein